MENQSTENTLNILKLKQPGKYKAMVMAGISYFDDESVVPNFIDDMEGYLIKCSNIINSGGTIILNHPIPEVCKELDKSISSLIEEINSDSITHEMAGIKIKNLYEKGMNIFKDYTRLYSPGDLESLERINSTFDLILSLQNVSVFSDEKLLK